MRRSLVVPVTIVGMLLAFVGAVVTTVVLVFSASDPAHLGADTGASPGLVGSLPVADSGRGYGRGGSPEIRTRARTRTRKDSGNVWLPGGRGRSISARPSATSWSPRPRCCRPRPKSVGVATGESVYYGGSWRKRGVQHLLRGRGAGRAAFLDTRRARRLAFPRRLRRANLRATRTHSLYAAWGLNFSTRAPGEYELCRQ